MRALAPALAFCVLAFAGSADAWTRLTSDSLPNYVGASVFTTRSGAELVGWPDGGSGAVMLLRPPETTPQALVSGWSQVGTPRFVQLRNGTLVAFFSGASPDQKLHGVVRMTSADDGVTWSAPAPTASNNTADVASAALQRNAKAVFVQAGSLFVNVYRGLGGEHVTNVFRPCCAYGPSIAVDSTGLTQVALWSLAPGLKGFLYGALSPSGSLVGSWVPLSGQDTIVDTEPVPIVADGAGDTFVAWSARSPKSTVDVTTFRGGRATRTIPVAGGAFGVSEPHIALAVDASDRLWLVWTQGGALWAARSRTAGASFGAAVQSPLPGGRTAYRVSALPDGDGVTAFLNLAAGGPGALWSQRLLPGLTVVASNGFLRVRDDGFPVAGAAVRSGSRVVETDAAGRVPLRALKRRSLVSIRRDGYASAVFRVP